MFNIVVNWLKRSTLWSRRNSSRSRRSRTIIFPLAFTSSSPRTGSRVFLSIGQSKRKGCEQTFRSCITVFWSFMLLTCLTGGRVRNGVKRTASRGGITFLTSLMFKDNSKLFRLLFFAGQLPLVPSLVDLPALKLVEVLVVVPVHIVELLPPPPPQRPLRLVSALFLRLLSDDTRTRLLLFGGRPSSDQPRAKVAVQDAVVGFALTNTEGSVKHVFFLRWKVQLDVSLQAPKKEGLQDAVKSCDDLLGLAGRESFLELGKVETEVGQWCP